MSGADPVPLRDAMLGLLTTRWANLGRCSGHHGDGMRCMDYFGHPGAHAFSMAAKWPLDV